MMHRLRDEAARCVHEGNDQNLTGRGVLAVLAGAAVALVVLVFVVYPLLLCGVS